MDYVGLFRTYGLEDPRPFQGCRDRTRPSAWTVMNRVLEEVYAPAIRRHLDYAAQVESVLYPNGRPKPTRRKRVRSWIYRHTPHVRVEWG